VTSSNAWNLRHCARHGHVTYAPDEPELRAPLVADTPVGEAWRCLRCWDFVPGPPSGTGPAIDAPPVPRGRALRDRFLLRALAVERAARALVLLLVAYGVWRFSKAQSSLSDTTNSLIPLLRPAADRIGWNIDHSWITEKAREALAADHSTLILIVFALIAYAALQFVEATGLWIGARWGEYFAVVATSLFLPWEIWELFHHATLLKIAGFVLNVAAVIWLVWSKHLFGARGGHAAFEAARHEESLLTVERAADHGV
jgi:uncharacterized membrane protein (DUF2068 family)